MVNKRPSSIASSSTAVAASAQRGRPSIGLYLMLAWMLAAFLALTAVLAVSKVRVQRAPAASRIVAAQPDAFSLMSLEEPSGAKVTVNVAPGASKATASDAVDFESTGSSGRTDPFAPLVSAPGAEPLGFGDVVRDPYQDVAFTGVIRNKSDAVAIIKLRSGGATLIRRKGAAFDLNGARVTVKRIESSRLWLAGPGGLRAIELESFVDRVNTASQDVAGEKDDFDKLAEPTAGEPPAKEDAGAGKAKAAESAT